MNTTIESNPLIDRLPSHLKQFINYRLCNNKLPIETGRWNGVDRHLRKCTLCNDEVGDEYHYVFNCKSFDTDRKKDCTLH